MTITNEEKVILAISLAVQFEFGEEYSLKELASKYMVNEEVILDCLEVFFAMDEKPSTGYQYLDDLYMSVKRNGDRLEVQGKYLGRLAEPPLRLTRDEAVMLCVAARALELAGIPAMSEDLQYLLGRLRVTLRGKKLTESAEYRNYVEDLAGRIVVKPTQDHLSLRKVALEAIDKRQVLNIEYYSWSSDRFSVRDIEPEELLTFRGNWYLLAWCRANDGWRFFRVDRIKRCEKTTNSFNKGSHGELPVFTDFISKGKHRVRLKFRDHDMWRIEEELIPRKIGKIEPDGWFSVEMDVERLEWLAKYLLRYGRNIRVESPEELKKQMRRLAEETLALYGNR